MEAVPADQREKAEKEAQAQEIRAQEHPSTLSSLPAEDAGTHPVKREAPQGTSPR